MSPRAKRVWLELLESRHLLSTASFAVVGDFGIAGTPENDVANTIKSWNPEFVITTGDNNYSTGSASTIDPNIGQYYHQFIGNYTGSYGAGSPDYNRFFPSLGNHDWGNVVGGAATAAPYLSYFTLPGTPPAPGADPSAGFRLPAVNTNTNERYYSFVWGPVQFFAIDSDKNEPDGTSSTSAQATWLQTALANSLNDTTVKWRIVYFHHAAYSSGNSHGNNAYMQWPFASWGATVVMSGHDHIYERIQNPSDGLTYFVEGTGGNTLNGFIASPVAGSTVRYSADYGAMKVLADSTHITFEHWTRATGSTASTLIDSYTISAPTAVPAAPSGLAVAVASATQLNLTWTDNSSEETGTRIERSTDGINFTEIGTVGANVTSYASTGLNPSTTYYYRVRAYNSLGNGGYSNIANNTTPFSTTTTLISTGSTWKYLVTAAAPAANWTTTGYDDSAWASGAAELGYGDTADGRPEATQIGYGPDANNKYPTTYFRKSFTVADASSFAAFTLRVMRDDGAVVHLNGREIWRTNMPNGTIGYATFSSSNLTGTPEFTYYQAGQLASLLTSGTNVLAVEIHQSNLTSADISFDLELVASTAPLAAPTNLTATTVSGTQINLAWTDTFASETGYKIERSLDGLTFDTVVTTTAVNATSYSDTGLNGGTTYYYRVRAVSGTNGDESVPSNVASARTQTTVTLLAAGSSWKYLVTASAAAATWKNAGFDDSAWPSGLAELGYNTDAADTADTQVTTIGYGPNASSKYPTTYFRTTFNVANPSVFSNITLNLLRDDGAVVYINGAEVVRSNMPGGTISYSTLASGAIPNADEEKFFPFTIAASNCIAGTNTIAVEVHQASATSTDLGFNLSIIGTATPPAAPTGLAATPVVSGAQVNLTWTDASTTESGFTIERSTDGVNFSFLAAVGANTSSYADTTIAVNTVYTYRVRASNLGGDSAWSGVASVEVEEAIISGRVVNDADNDGVADPEDFGLAGWTVYVDANLNAQLDPAESFAVTNSLGEYALGGLFGGTYTIRAVAQAGWTLSAPGAAGLSVTLNNSDSANNRNFGALPPTNYTGTAGDDAYTVRLSPDGLNIDVFYGAVAATPTYRIRKSIAGSLNFALGNGNDTLTLSGINGTPVSAYGLSFDGGAGSNTVTFDGGDYYMPPAFFEVTGDLQVNILAGTSLTIGDPPANLAATPITLNGTLAAMFVAQPVSPVVELLDGNTVLGAGAAVSFGNLPLGEAAILRTFTLRNVGTLSAEIGTIRLPDGYVLVTPPASELAPGASTTFTVALLSNVTGQRAGNLEVPVLDSGDLRVAVSGKVTAPVGTGLLGHYYTKADLTNLKFTRVDSGINFNWGKSAPASSLPKDKFSVRWTGQILPLVDDVYTFYTRANDGVRLWVDGKQIINRWTGTGTTLEDFGSVWLAGGVKHSIVLEYFDGAGNANVALTWSSSTMSRQAIARNQLFATEVTSAFIAPFSVQSNTTAKTASLSLTTLPLEVNALTVQDKHVKRLSRISV